MRAPFTQLYIHCVWATWDRLPLITPTVEDIIYASIHAKGHELKCEVLALGGMLDHVHLLARFPTTLSVADLVKGVKGTSSHLQTQQVAPGSFFKRQGGYGAFTVSPDVVPSVTAYIQNQLRHHAAGNLWTELEVTQTPEMPPAQ